MNLYSLIKSLESSFQQPGGAIYAVVIAAYQKQLMRPRVFAAAMDLLCFYQEDHRLKGMQFATFRSGRHNSLY